MPKSSPAFHLAASPDCAIAQRVQLALLLRGAAPEVTGLRMNTGASGKSRLTYRAAGQAALVLHDGLAMLELIEDLFPDLPLHPADPVARARHREVIGKILVAHDNLSAVLAARDPRDLDLAIYRLREILRGIEDALEPVRSGRPSPLTNLDICLVPLVWRLRVIDRGFLAGLGAGLPRLRDHADWLLADPAVVSVLDDASATCLLARIKESGAALACPDISSVWERAFASVKPENKLLQREQRTKVPSIGRPDALR